MQAPIPTNSQAVTKPAGSSLLPPTGTLVLCLATIAVSIAQSIWDGGRWTQAVGVVPASLLSLSSLTSTADGQLIPVWLTLLSYVFPHGGWWHVLPNMAALWVFGAIAEPVMGTRKFVLTYFVSGVMVGAAGGAGLRGQGGAGFIVWLCQRGIIWCLRGWRSSCSFRVLRFCWWG